jgi:hypothetical protein
MYSTIVPATSMEEALRQTIYKTKVSLVRHRREVIPYPSSLVSEATTIILLIAGSLSGDTSLLDCTVTYPLWRKVSVSDYYPPSL